MGDISREMGRKGKKAAPPPYKKTEAACRETPRRTSAETHPASAAPARRPPRVRMYPRGTARRSDTDRSQARFEGHSSVPKLGNDRTAFPEWTAGSGRETCLRVDSGHTPHAPPSGADFKTGCNDPKSSRYPTAELRIDGLSKMPERCCCPKRCTCQGFAHLPANRDSTK